MSCCFFPEWFDTFVTARSSTWLGMTCWTLNDFSWVEPNGSYSHSYYAEKRKLKWTQENLEFKSNLGTRQVHYVGICPVKLPGHFHIFCGKWTCFPAIQFYIFPYFSIATTVEILWFSCHPQWCEKSSRLAFLLTRWSGKSSRTSCWTTDSCWLMYGGFLQWGVPPDYQFLFGIFPYKPGMGGYPHSRKPLFECFQWEKLGSGLVSMGRWLKSADFLGIHQGFSPWWFHLPMFFQKSAKMCPKGLTLWLWLTVRHGIDGP